MGKEDIRPGAQPKEPFDDIEFLDIPAELKAAKKRRVEGKKSPEEIKQEQAFEQLTHKTKSQYTGQRKLPVVIDVLLYPFSRAAMAFLCVIFGVPLVMYILIGAVKVAMLSWFVLISVDIIIEGVLGLYLLWYYCQCIRDSGEGGTRAPETIAIAPSLGEILWQCLKFMICFLICIGPFLSYSFSLFTEALGNTSLWGQVPNITSDVMTKGSIVSFVLLTSGIFFFPIVLLSVIMFDSLWGLNPLLIISSIFSTFFQYTGLLLLYFVMGAFVFGAMFFCLEYLKIPVDINGFFGRCLSIYISLICAHLLGRFYWRYQKKLKWDF
jgi:hypothetical protein